MGLANFPHRVGIRVPERLDPATRAARYEAPLGKLLDRLGIGEVVGAGVRRNWLGRVEHQTVDLALDLADDATIGFLTEELRRLGAPPSTLVEFEQEGEKIQVPIAMPPLATYSADVIRDMAAKILRTFDALKAYPMPRPVPLDRAAFPLHDFRWYDDTTRELARDGLRDLGEWSLDLGGGMPAIASRKLHSDDGRVRGEFGQIRQRLADVRVATFATELRSGDILVTLNGQQSWDAPPGCDAEYLPPETSPHEVLERHVQRVEALFAARPGEQAVVLRDLEGVLASEARQQKRAAEWRQGRGTPTAGELARMGTQAELAEKIVEAMQRLRDGTLEDPAESSSDEDQPMAAPGPGAEAIDGWMVVAMVMPRDDDTVDGLVRHALDQGIAQVQAAGSPLHPCLIVEPGAAYFLIDAEGGRDPMDVVLKLLRRCGTQARRCALVLDTRVQIDGVKHDAITAMVCERGAGQGQVWARTYRPKRFLRPCKPTGEAEQIAAPLNLFDEAVATPAAEPAESPPATASAPLPDTVQAKPTGLQSDLSPDADAFLQAACREIKEKHAQLESQWGYGQQERWDFDGAAGILKLTFKGGRTLLADGQVLGSYLAPAREFEWAWNNPNVSRSVSRDSAMTRIRCKPLGIRCTQVGKIPVPSDEALAYLGAIGVKASGSQGLLSGSAGELQVLILMKNLRWSA